MHFPSVPKFYSICSVSLWQPLDFSKKFERPTFELISEILLHVMIIVKREYFLWLQSHFLPSGYHQQVSPRSHNVISKDGESHIEAGRNEQLHSQQRKQSRLVFVCYASSSKVFDSLYYSITDSAEAARGGGQIGQQ